MRGNAFRAMAITGLLCSLLFPCSPVRAADFTCRSEFGKNGYGIAWGDFNGDGLWDAAVACSSYTPIHLYTGHVDGSFTETAPFDSIARSSRALACADWDNDGQVDLVASDPIYCYRNLGNARFEETPVPSFAALGPGISFGDCNNDGWVDLLGAGDSGQTRIYRNQGGIFERASIVLPVTRGGTWVDLDSDGLLDLVLNHGLQCIYENVGSDSFVSHPTGLPNGMPYCVSGGDFDNDGDLDVASNEFLSQLLENDGDFCFTTTRPFGVGTRSVQSCGWADCDNDGNLDIAFAIESTVFMFTGNGNGSFVREEITYCGSPRGLAWCDYDDDGDLDLAVMNAAGTNYIMRNEVNDANYVKVRLAGRCGPGYSNRTGIGARIALFSSDHSRAGLREISGGVGTYTSMDVPEAHFGAAAGDTFTVIITWPASGIVDTIPDVIPPARLEVVENRRPGIFSLAAPPKGAEVGRKPTFEWRKSVDPDGDPVTYDLWYGRDPTFKVRAEVKGLADTTWTPSILLDSACYYWKVLAVDRAHQSISYRNHYTDTVAVDSVGAETWSNEKYWYFSATAAGIAESGQRRPGVQISLSVGQNPARGAVRVGYTAAAGGLLEVFSADGRLTLAQPMQGAGTLALGRSLPQGVYFVRLTVDRQERTAKVVKLD